MKLNREHLVRTLNRFDSLHPEEWAEAAQDAKRQVWQAGTSWEALLLTKEDHRLSHVDAAQACLKSRKKLDDFDRHFLDGVQEFEKLSDKQISRLSLLCKACRVKW